MTACIRGCGIRGQHLTDCAGDDCRGCLPRPAEHGLLCAWDWTRLNGDVVEAASLVRHLRDDVADPESAGSSAPATDGPRAYRDPSEGSVLSDAIGAADEVHATLAEVAAVILDAHPGRLTGPSEVGAWRTRQTLATDGVTGEQYVIPSRIVGVRDPIATDNLVAWMLPLLPWVAEQEWVVDVRADLATIVRTTHARWPLEADHRGRRLPMPCPTCHTIALHLSPAIPARPTTIVTCTNPECARMFTEDEWDHLRDQHEHTTGRTYR